MSENSCPIWLSIDDWWDIVEYLRIPETLTEDKGTKNKLSRLRTEIKEQVFENIRLELEER